MVNTHSFPKLCKRTTAGLLSMLLAAMAIPQIPADASANGFYVSGTSIKDANGKDFVVRGVNIAHAWYSSYTSTSIKGAAANGANTVRVVVADGNKWSKTSNSELKDIVSACKKMTWYVSSRSMTQQAAITPPISTLL